MPELVHAAKLKANNRKIRIMFCDESSFGMISDNGRCWAPPGIRPHVPRHFIRNYTYDYCAVSPHDGEMVSLILPYENHQMMSMFLSEVASRFSDEHVAMFMDQAGWHISKDLKVPENMSISLLPPYSPELNPTEHIWDELEEKWFVNRFFRNFEDMEDQLCRGLKSLEDNPKKVQKLTGFPWITRIKLNAD